jgi:transglutaminase-like putative cysteine protease
MNRRDFISASAAFSTLAVFPPFARKASAATLSETQQAGWRTFEITTEVELKAGGRPRLWLPVPLYRDTEYQRLLSNEWKGNTVRAGIYRDVVYGSPVFYAEWDDKIAAPGVQLVSQFSTRDRSVDFMRPQPTAFNKDEIELYLKPTKHIPTDGIVGETSRKIVGNLNDPVDKSRAIYEWIVDNTFRDPKVRGCGIGDISFMLETGNLGGKCADINALFVGLARAAGVPARDVYGVRVATSANFKSLGKSGDITKAQHCRAEFFDARYGWIPVDPADVRKVVLEEESQIIPIDHPKVLQARSKLFGFWEMNWVGFNTAGDVQLPPPPEESITFFMYPYAQTTDGKPDSLDPQSFRYKMTSREITA